MSNRLVQHNYPPKDDLYEWPFIDAEGGVTPHVHGGDEEHCWCVPTVLEWGLRPDGRNGWVTVTQGKTYAELIRDSRPTEEVAT